MINGKRMLTVDIHCHSYVHDVWPLISERDEISYLRHLINTVGVEQIVIGTDFPFALGSSDAVDHVLSVPGLNFALL